MVKEDERIRTLEEICEKHDFRTYLQGNCYCSLSKAKEINCRWLSVEKDKNGLYPCLKSYYQGY